MRIPSNVAGNPGVPLGGDTNAALGYCKFRVGTNPDGSPILSSTIDVLFTAASPTAQVTVYVNVPSPVVSGNYYWNIYGTDWPTGTTPAINDAGHTINATVLPPIVNPTVKPVIVNLLPTNGTNYTYDAPTPVAVAISFTANCNATTAQGGATIEQLAASFDTTSLSVTPTGLLSTNPDGTFTASGTVTHYITDAGPHTIKVSATNTAGTTFATTQINILAPPTITSADHTTFVYGDAGSYAVTVTGYPAPTFSATGLPSWASINSTTGVISGTPGAAAGSVFTFTITATNSVTTPNNPTGTSTQTFTLNVVPRPLTVKAIADTKVYGSADPSSFGYSVTSGSFVGTDAFSGALVRDAGESVGSYKINQGTLTAGSNYSIDYVDANFTITPKALTVSATAADKTYDGLTTATFTATGSPQLNGKVGTDDVALGSGVTAAFADKNVGTNRDVTLSGLTLTGTTAGNYTLTAPGVLKASITRAPLTIAANSQIITYGATPAAFSASYSGFVNGEQPTVLLTPVGFGTTPAISVSPVPAGTYTIIPSGATAANYTISFATGALVVNKAPQTITFGPLAAVTVGAAPFNLTATGGGSGNPVVFASDNNSVASVSGNTVIVGVAGSANITATQAGNANYFDAAPVTQVLTVNESTGPSCGTAIVRHAPKMDGNAGVDGSLQVLLPESMALNGNAWISESLLVRGTPELRLDGHPTYGAIIDGAGLATPTNFTIKLNGQAAVGRLVRHTNEVAMPPVALPPSPTGTRDVKLNGSNDTAGDFSTIRDLTVNGNTTPVTVPAGTYRDITVTGKSGVILGVPGALTPSVYNVRSLKFTGNSTLAVVGPVIINVAEDVDFDELAGNSDHPEWLALNLYKGDLRLDGTVSVFAYVLTPQGEVTINGQGKLCGGLICDRLTLNGWGLVDLCGCTK